VSLTLAEARHSLLRIAGCLPAESVSLPEAAGRIILETITARRSLPEGDRAAVDGYAVRLADAAARGASGLRVAGTATAGLSQPLALPPHHALAVTTGAPLPLEADAVVPQEAVRQEGERVVLRTIPTAGTGIRRAGQEARAGELLVASGDPLDIRTLERLAGQGIPRVSVARRARVHLVATGDELAPPGEEPRAAQRVASNLPMLEALVRACGGQVERSVAVPDDPAQLHRVLAASLGGDLVLTVGGTLGGVKDFTKRVLAGAGGAFLFDGVAMRPGSSCAVVTVGKAIIVCLPGSPGAALLGFVALVRPLLRALHGWSQPIPSFSARLAEAVQPASQETILVSGLVRDVGGGLEFLRRGHGWPALGLVPPSGPGQVRDPFITVELLPSE
jgi:molybdopterin molybdotransferase